MNGAWLSLITQKMKLIKSARCGLEPLFFVYMVKYHDQIRPLLMWICNVALKSLMVWIFDAMDIKCSYPISETPVSMLIFNIALEMANKIDASHS
jgi:hypothetical protein